MKQPDDDAEVGSLQVVVAEPEGLSADTLAQLCGLGPIALGPFSRVELLDVVPAAVVLMVRLAHRIDGAVLAAAPRLRTIISATTGLNHIDLETCRARDINVICLQAERAFLATITSTAELALALLLNLVRHVLPAHADVLAGYWRRDNFRGLSVRGMTLGVVGLGRLGCVMAGYGRAMGMDVVATDPSPEMVPTFVTHVDLDQVLAVADCISLHASHEAGKPPILGEREFALMKGGALLVNTARGELVDEHALLESLENGHLGGYGADVVADETSWNDFTEHPLVQYARRCPNVVITPHIGGATLDGLQRSEAFAVNKALQHFGLEVGAGVL